MILIMCLSAGIQLFGKNNLLSNHPLASIIIYFRVKVHISVIILYVTSYKGQITPVPKAAKNTIRSFVFLYGPNFVRFSWKLCCYIIIFNTLTNLRYSCNIIQLYSYILAMSLCKCFKLFNVHIDNSDIVLIHLSIQVLCLLVELCPFIWMCWVSCLNIFTPFLVKLRTSNQNPSKIFILN